MEENCLNSPLPLVYVDGSIIKVCQKLDLSHKSEIIGFMTDNTVWSKDQIKDSWNMAYWLIENSSLGHRIYPNLPQDKDFKNLRDRQNLVLQTVALLKMHAIVVDEFDEKGFYWLKDSFSSTKAYAFSFKDQLNTLVEKSSENTCYIRLVWHLD